MAALAEVTNVPGPKQPAPSSRARRGRGRGGRGGRGRGGRGRAAVATAEQGFVVTLATEPSRQEGDPRPQSGQGGRRRQKAGGEGGGGGKGKKRPGQRIIRGKNTTNFKPGFDPPAMRVVIGRRGETFGRVYGVHDVVVCPELFCDADDLNVYAALMAEIKAAGQDSLWELWHGNSHMIADDHKMGGKWKEQMPTLLKVVDKIRTYFKMDVQATRFNWYRDSSDWKPYHHDAAALKPHMAKKQNITIAASFGAEREVSFQHATNGCVTDIPLPNGSAYAFGRDLNLDWKHGILQLPPDQQHADGRISIIAWGWVDQQDDDGNMVQRQR